MTDRDLEAKIENLYVEACEQAGVDQYYLDEYIETAALKASVIFKTFGYDYGDRSPGVYKLRDTLRELFITVLKREEDNWCETGMFRVMKTYYDYEESPEFQIDFVLNNFSEHRIKDNE